MPRTCKIKFRLDAPHAKAVGLAGTFDDWDAERTPLKKRKDGVWTVSVPLPAGRHEYRFVVDGQWINDPNAQESTPNPHGGANSVIVV